MKFPRITRRITMLLAASALLLGIPAAATAYAASATTGTGWIRLTHLSPNTPAVDVYLYSFGNSNAQIVLHHVAYGTVSPYEIATAGDYSVAMRASGASPSSPPVLSTSVTIKAGHAYTVAGMGPESGLRLQVLDDQLTTPPGKAVIRVIQGVRTGFGGTAPHGPGSPLPWLAAIGVGALITLTGGLRLRRNGLRRQLNTGV